MNPTWQIVITGVAILLIVGGIVALRIRLRFSDLWQWHGTVDRAPYALLGVLLFAIMHNLGMFVATYLFRGKFELFKHWIPPTEAAMLATALPFLWPGTVLTLRRLRAVRLPIWLVLFFFVPVVNLILFGLLSVLPSVSTEDLKPRPRSGRMHALLANMVPEGRFASAAMALVLALPFGVLATVLSVTALASYGWGLFVALPFCLGLGSVLLHGYHAPRSYGSCLLVACLSTLLLGVALLAVAIEGAICIALAAPLGLILAAIGGTIGYFIQSHPRHRDATPAMTSFLMLVVPALMGAGYLTPSEPPRWEVHTAIDIDAPPEAVWPFITSFPDLPAPTYWLFRMGVGYPIRADIQGRGLGALRRCLFSTGTFVEPITAWDEPRLLKFSVASQPPPMREMSPYAGIHPRHLDGYLQPDQARFLLVPLPGGRTRLEGTSWYRHSMWPAQYWRLWSDSVVHHIHLRVFEHVKRLAEARQTARGL